MAISQRRRRRRRRRGSRDAGGSATLVPFLVSQALDILSSENASLGIRIDLESSITFSDTDEFERVLDETSQGRGGWDESLVLALSKA